MILPLLHPITRYMDFLKNQYGLQITVHHLDIGLYFSYFAPHNIHGNPYCSCVKMNRTVWRACIDRQDKVCKACEQGPFWGTCHAGVYEYVYPLRYNEQVCGFLCVSGYKREDEAVFGKIRHFADTYEWDYRTLAALYRTLPGDVPEEAFLDTVLSVLADSFTLLLYYIKQAERKSCQEQTSGYAIFSRALAYINFHFETPVTVEEIAADCHCSPAQLSRIFNKMAGRSIHGYINHLRVEKAKVLLTNTDLTVTEIAYALGFSDSNYFTRIFRQHCRMSPRAYRFHPSHP